MNNIESKKTLVLFRPETDDYKDPAIAEALAKTGSDADLANWLEEHSARQRAIRRKFRSIPIPAGLKEQIISEAAAARKSARRLRNLALASSAIVVAACLLAFFVFNKKSDEFGLSRYQRQMVSNALRGYAMDLHTADLGAIQAHLRRNNAPADVKLPDGLTQAGVLGCSVQFWNGSKVSLICFKTGKPLPPGQQNDMWLYAVEQKSVKDANVPANPKIEIIDQLATATWAQDGKLYFLGVLGNEDTLRKFL